jgi:hypothetical protein
MLAEASVPALRDLQGQGCKAVRRSTVQVSLTAGVMPSQEHKSTLSVSHAAKWASSMSTRSWKPKTPTSPDHQTMTSSPALVWTKGETVTLVDQKMTCLFFICKSRKSCLHQPATSQTSTLQAKNRASLDFKISPVTRLARPMIDSEWLASKHQRQTVTNQRITLSRTLSRTLSITALLFSEKVSVHSSTSTGSRTKPRSCQHLAST